MSGNETDELELEFANPADGDTEAEEDVKRSWTSCGSVEEVYCPGSKSTEVDSPDADKVLPTGSAQSTARLYCTKVTH